MNKLTKVDRLRLAVRTCSLQDQMLNYEYSELVEALASLSDNQIAKQMMEMIEQLRAARVNTMQVVNTLMDMEAKEKTR